MRQLIITILALAALNTFAEDSEPVCPCKGESLMSVKQTIYGAWFKEPVMADRIAFDPEQYPYAKANPKALPYLRYMGTTRMRIPMSAPMKGGALWMLGLIGDKSDLVLVERYLKEWFFQSLIKRSDIEKKSRLANEEWPGAFGSSFGAMVGMMIERKVPGAREMVQKYTKIGAWNKAHEVWLATYLRQLEAQAAKKRLDAYDTFPNAKKENLKALPLGVYGTKIPFKKADVIKLSMANFMAMVTFMSDDGFVAQYLKGYPDQGVGKAFQKKMINDLGEQLKVNNYDKLMKQEIDPEKCKAQIGIKGKCAAKADKPIDFIMVGVDAMDLGNVIIPTPKSWMLKLPKDQKARPQKPIEGREGADKTNNWNRVPDVFKDERMDEKLRKGKKKEGAKLTVKQSLHCALFDHKKFSHKNCNPKATPYLKHILKYDKACKHMKARAARALQLLAVSSVCSVCGEETGAGGITPQSPTVCDKCVGNLAVNDSRAPDTNEGCILCDEGVSHTHAMKMVAMIIADFQRWQPKDPDVPGPPKPIEPEEG